MRSQTQPNVVHEAQSQRQHIRVELPGVIEIGEGAERRRYKLHDVSAGGFAFESGRHGFRVGESHRGHMAFSVDGIAITLAVSFQVRNAGADGRVGCAFLELGAREISALRHLIGAHLAGELTTAGEVLHSVGRDNFTKARGDKAPGAIARAGSQMRALVVTLCLTIVGAVAFTYAVRHLGRLVFVTEATAAKVAGPVYTVEMPREGTFHSLVPPDGIVKKGAALASFDAPVIDLLSSDAIGSNLSIEQLQKMMGVTIKGSISSPCDCRVHRRFVADEQYVARGQPVMDLTPVDLDPHVIARFRGDQLGDIAQGSLVHFRVHGDPETRSGRIAHIASSGQYGSVDSDVLATIQPAEPIPADLLGRPTIVTLGELPTFADISLMLSGTANAAERSGQ